MDDQVIITYRTFIADWFIQHRIQFNPRSTMLPLVLAFAVKHKKFPSILPRIRGFPPCLSAFNLCRE
ncbi:hypothetical protein Y958_20545 [Nitrospirillum viridazoti CBAmc]|uniref:Uncharacterized protein n=1 Tax=Nitrospirillum viridazoti CBAmc TaxID=1441467 RepID=A0A248JWY4_9PROT|nr:hypothetical protein Y958_20545 [Nitrospirillum amazonense CBAmc]